MKKILVTGSEGSLMQYVIPVLLKKGYEVIGVDNFARYGEIERKRNYKHPSKEEDAFESTIPSTDYGMSKLVGEKLCRAFARQYGINYVIWRPFNIITPHEVAEKEQGLSHVFADFIKNLIVEKKNPLPIMKPII